MKAVILAGGLGIRISEESGNKPKPMVEIGGKPVLWHIMKIYSHYGINDFIICLGYKGFFIKEYFANYFLHQSDITIDIQNNSIEVHNNLSEPWKVTLIDTGNDTMTGGRIKKIQKYIDGTFMLAYGDSIADIDLTKLLAWHRSHGKVATITSTQPEGRFGALQIGDDQLVRQFMEKPQGDGSWLNAGFFVCEPGIFDYIGDDPRIIFEKEPLGDMASAGELVTYKHSGFWKSIDTLRDKQQLESLWGSGNAKWQIWDN